MSTVTTSARPVRLHVVANRLPVTWEPTQGWVRAPGGLVTALEAYGRRRGVDWVGSSATLGEPRAVAPTWRHGPIHRVLIEPELARLAVAGLANSALWPAFHGVAGQMRWNDDWWAGYVEYNQRFADAAITTASPGDRIWIHDYPLLLAPAMIARVRPDLAVGLSIHTPVEAETLAALPCAGELAVALASTPLVGVQTSADRESLQTLVASSVGTTDESSRRCFVSPVSIDPDELIALVNQRATHALVERFRSRAGRRLLVVGIDRLDYTKAILQRLDAVDQAFRRGWLQPDDVDIIQIASPTRADVPGYRQLRLEAERRAHEVASHWLRPDGTPPLRLVPEGRDRRHVAALLAAGDIALVTPSRDGMHLVAKEFSILNEAHGGVLVLGAGAGAAQELGDGSVLVDGNDPSSVADGLRQAASMGVDARRALARRRADAVRGWTAQDWAGDFERRLVDVADRSGGTDHVSPGCARG